MSSGRIIWLLLFALLAACAPVTWQMVDTDSAQFASERFAVALPGGWMRYGTDPDGILLSRDGVGLQYASLNNLPHEQAFKPLNKRSTPSLLPSELAELTIALLKTQQGMTRIDILENRPAVISGRHGFRLHVGFENQQGLNYEGVLYGLVDDERFYLLSFYATQIHYFQRDLPVFEALVRSFRLI